MDCRSRRSPEKLGCRVRRCTRGWPVMRPRASRGWWIGRIGRVHVRIRCPPMVEARLLELRRSRPYWGPRRLVFELAKRGVSPVPSESAAYRALVRAAMIDPHLRDRRSRKWKRWERAAPMELWQMDVVGGFPLSDGTSAKALTGIDDHSRMCVCARLMTARAHPGGLRWAARGAGHLRCTRADPDR